MLSLTFFLPTCKNGALYSSPFCPCRHRAKFLCCCLVCLLTNCLIESLQESLSVLYTYNINVQVIFFYQAEYIYIFISPKLLSPTIIVHSNLKKFCIIFNILNSSEWKRTYQIIPAFFLLTIAGKSV